MGNFSMVIECNFEGNLWVIFLYLNVIFCVWLVYSTIFTRNYGLLLLLTKANLRLQKRYKESFFHAMHNGRPSMMSSSIDVTLILFYLLL